MDQVVRALKMREATRENLEKRHIHDTLDMGKAFGKTEFDEGV
jgi:hypothetical protein